MSQALFRRHLLLSTLIIWFFGALAFHWGCDSPEAEEVEIEFPDLDPQVILPPGYPAHLDGSTLVVYGYANPPKVHSYPSYAGVNSQGELGIGSAAGYDPGDSFVLPINANLGDKSLKSYQFLLMIDHPNLLQLKWVSGNNPQLAKKYPAQYQPAPGFNFEPLVQNGATPGYLYISATGTQSATGRINLNELKFKILKKLPPSGIIIEFIVQDLKDDQDQDLCAQFPNGCIPQSGIIISNFRIKQ